MNEFQAIMNLLVLLAVISCGFSIMLGPLTGRKNVDPFLIVRPFFRCGMRLPTRLCRGLSQTCQHGAKAAWHKASHRRGSPALMLLFGFVWLLLSLTAFIFAIPAELFSEATKKH